MIYTLYEIRNALAEGKTIYELPLKVTFYARVSTDKYEQKNSLVNQITYYKEFIKNNRFMFHLHESIIFIKLKLFPVDFTIYFVKFLKIFF